MSFSSLEIGKRALLVQRFGLDITGNNIANVNTPGYSRRMPIQSETEQLRKQGNYLGTGVFTQKVQSFREEYYDKEIRNSLSRISNYKSDDLYLHQIETIFTEPSDYNIGKIMSEFLNKFDEFTTKPESIALRMNMLNIGVTLTERINQTANSLAELRADSKKKLLTLSNDINKNLEEIANLNNQILRSNTTNNSESQQLIDERAKTLENLAKIIDIKIGNNDDGSVNIFVNGINLLTADAYSKVKMVENTDPVSGERTLKIFKFDEYNNTNIELEPLSGEVYSNLKLYNYTLDDKDTTNQFSIAKKFDDFIVTFASKINSISTIGYGLYDQVGSNPQRPIFTSKGSQLNAFTININQNLLNNPQDVPLSSISNESGNVEIARMISRLSVDDNFLDNQTPSDYYSNFIGKIGTIAKETKNSLASSELIEQQLDSQRESLTGVNLDEEAINLIKYQKAFEAAARIVSTTNDILGTLVNLGR